MTTSIPARNRSQSVSRAASTTDEATPAAVIEAIGAKKKPELKRKRCKYSGCNRVFQQARADHEFCRKECRFAYHKFGSAFGTLEKKGLDKLVREAEAKLTARIPALATKAVQQLIANIDRRITSVQKQVDGIDGEYCTVNLLDSRITASLALLEKRIADLESRIQRS